MKTVLRVVLAASTMCAVAGSAMGAPVDVAKKQGVPPGPRPLILLPGSVTDGPGISDNFDSYANGSPLVGQGGWLYWNGSGPPAAMNATVDNTLSASAPNSAVSVLETDVVQVFNITTGKWVCKAKTYVPSAATGIGYFIMLNTFTHPYVSGGNWSIELDFIAATNVVTSINRSVANGGPGNTTLPLIRDAWVEVVVNIDLDMDTFDVTYGGMPLVPPSPMNKWSQNTSATVGAARIQCIDLYSQMVGFRWDDVSLLPVVVPSCKANCDASTVAPCLNVNDFICFNNLFATGSNAANCDASTTPPILNVNDFICFNNAFAASCANPCAAP
ncbi:MAG: hypothetical protein ACKVW3_06445 [Phycisphaerales bacterium]